MTISFTDAELAAYLDEALPAEQMSAIECAMEAAGDEAADLTQRLQSINRRRDSGVHTLGEIWRRHHISCPSRAQLGSFILGVLPADEKNFITHHIETVGCRICQANLEDLHAEQQSQQQDEVQHRRRRYFQSSVGHLKGE